MIQDICSSFNKLPLQLWFKQPASNWKEAIPLGNGHMGAMIYGNTEKETINLTELTCFSGEKGHTLYNNNAAESFYSARKALLENDYESAQNNLRHFVGERSNYGTHLPLGNLILKTDVSPLEVTEYERRLCLNTAVSSISYRYRGCGYSYTAFVSNPHRVMVMQLVADKPQLNVSFSLNGANNPYSIEIEGTDYRVSGNAYEKIHSDGKSGVAFQARLRVIPSEGTYQINEQGIHVHNASRILLFLAVETSFNGTSPSLSCAKRINNATHLSYEALLHAHIADYDALFRRVQLSLGEEDVAATDILLEKVQKGYDSPFLTALMFQYGRYLLISSSRENSSLPTPLQGVWNDSVACRIGWTCDMHLDINTQMNYWPAEVTNLSECHEPLFRWIESSLVPMGRQTARIFYHLNGWVAELVSNAWGFSDPYWHINLSPCPTGGAWIATHMWEHYLFTQSEEFLHRHAFPVILEAVRFFVDYVFEDPNTGYLTSGPSISPENHFIVNEKPYSASLGPFYEIAVIRELFDIFLKATGIIQYNDTLIDRVHSCMKALPPFQINEAGELKEWSHHYKAKDPQHRHTSHLLALFPFSQITPEDTPLLAEAAQVTIKNRLTPLDNWEDTGWARSMLMLYAARLKGANQALDHIITMQKKLTNSNLMVKHPPTRGAPAFADVYELDGNTGLTACVAEMLMQSHRDEIQLLPALPCAWKTGYAKGLCARGGFVLDISWKDELLICVKIVAKANAMCRLRYKDSTIQFQATAGEQYWYDTGLSRIKECDCSENNRI